jgi:hypothetical protein
MRRFFGVMSVVVGFFAVRALTLRANERATPKGLDEGWNVR